MAIEPMDSDGKYQILVDSHNHAKTFGVARTKVSVEHNKFVLELPPKETILKEIGSTEENLILFPFGRYIVVYNLVTEILFFLDYMLEVDKPILELLLQCKVTDTFLEHFFDVQYNQIITFKTLDDTVVIKRSS